MKTKIYSRLIAAALLASPLMKSQSVSYNYIRDDPFDIKNFSAAIDPFFIDLNGHNGYAFGWGARAEHMMGKSLLINFDIRTGFGTKDYRKSNENTRNYFNMEGGLGLVLVNRAKQKRVPIVLSQSTSGNTRTTTYIKGGVPANTRLIVAFRGGFIQYTNTLNYKNLDDSLLTLNGRPFKTLNEDTFFTDKSGAAPVTIPKVGGIALTTIYAGFQFRKIVNLVIDVSGYGTRSNIRYSDFYMDFLFAPVVGIKDFRMGDGSTGEVEYSEISRMGWRLGWFFRKPKDQGFSWKIEMGSRPGFKAPTNTNLPVNMKNMYAMMTFGLYVPFKIKPVYQGETQQQ